MTGHNFLMMTCVCLASLSAVAQESQQIAAHPEMQGALGAADAWFDAEQAFHQIPGMSVGVVLDQDLIWSNGYGFSNVADKVAADKDTIYSICSISKLFTSISVMQLRDAGKLRLSDPIAQHLDWYDLKQAHHGGPVTIEGVLTHSSGLPRESDFYYWNGPDFAFPTREKMIEALRDQETLYPAQTWSQYSNLGLSLAGEIVSARSGEPYNGYVQASILAPLGMADTRPFFPTDLHGDQMAIGYTGINRDGERSTVVPFYTRGITPAAGFTSSVADLAKFASWQFRLLENGGEEVLDANTLREMHRVHWVSPDWQTTWGIGFVVRKSDEGNYSMVGHGGGCPGYITFFAMSPSHKLAVIVLTNAGDGPSARIASSLMNAMVQALQKSQSPSTEESADLSRYEGNFSAQPWGGESAVRQWGDHLILLRLPADDLGTAMMRLNHVEGDTFVRVTDAGEERELWHFDMGDDGKASVMRRHRFRAMRIR